MVIHQLTTTPPPELRQALSEFESTFLFPFGAGRAFRIDYGSDRTAFVRTVGEGNCIAAEKEGRIIGVIEMALVNLLRPDGTETPAVYFPDIKLLPEARARLTAGRLLQAASEWARTRADLWFTVALDGIPVSPLDYTGRAGIPPFSAAARLMVVRLPLAPHPATGQENGRFLAGAQEGEALYKRLARGRYGLLGGAPEARSIAPPAWMAHPGGMACARFEDRRKVRRLIADDGSELRPAYRSCFTFQDPQAAVDLIVAAMQRAEALGFRALRFCLPPPDLAMLQRVLGPGVIEGAGGTIFTTGATETGALWTLNAAEI